MTTRIHLSIMQPAGYVHSQGLLDQARYARYQFRRLGAEVTIGKNRLREDSINVIFGAHLGFDANLKQRYTCVFFNLEQLGEGGARVSRDYMNLLSTSAVIDYDERNLAAYECKVGDVPVVSFQWAPYLATTSPLPIEDRPIDLLFFGSINERRKAIFSRIEACGWSVSMFDHPLYGEERDRFIRQAKAVFNCHFYESSRFEQARAFHTLSLGTPVISERTAKTTPPAAFEEAVTWLTDEQLELFFREEFMSCGWVERACAQLEAFALTDASPAWRVVHDYCLALGQMNRTRIHMPWRPVRLQIESGASEQYEPGWLHISTNEPFKADVSLDLSENLALPLRLPSTGGGYVELAANQLETICIRDDLLKIRAPEVFIENLLRLLKPEGRLEVMTPLHILPWLMNESKVSLTPADLPWFSLLDRFWASGNLEHRFEIVGYDFVDARRMSCSKEHAGHIVLALHKAETTVRELTLARMYLPDFGVIPHDEVIAQES